MADLLALFAAADARFAQRNPLLFDAVEVLRRRQGATNTMCSPDELDGLLKGLGRDDLIPASSRHKRQRDS